MLATAPSTRGIKLLFAAVGITFAVLVGSVVANLVGTSPSREVDRIALADVPEGASFQRAGDRAVVLVRDGDEITAFASAVPPRTDPLVWCATEGHFGTALYASRYELDGTRTIGPGPARLHRLETTVVDDHVEVGAVYPIDWPRLSWTSAAAARFADPPGDVC